jgi:hypothetical protein
MSAMSSDSGLWRFAGDETWYLNLGEGDEPEPDWFANPQGSPLEASE